MNVFPNEDEIRYIRESLRQFNDATVGEDSHTPLGIVEYDDDGNVIA